MRKEPFIITLDTETYNGLIGSIKRIAVYDGKEVTYGYSFLDIEPIILKYSKKYDVHVYIHNLEFDLRKMPELFKDNRIVWEKSLAIKGRLATVKTKDYTIHDSFKLLPMSLAKLSHDFDVEHGKLDLFEEVKRKYGKYTYKNVVDFLDRCDKDNPLYLKYLGYDVMSLYEVLLKLMDVSGIPIRDFVKRVSTASISRYIYKNGFKGKLFKNDGETKTDYEFLTTYNWRYDLETEEFLRAAYCGGRTEVFKIKLDKLGRHYDINSQYPFAMLGEFPIGKPTMLENPVTALKNFNIWKSNKKGLGFLHCAVYIPQQNIPPLPVKMGKLTFPCGHVYGVWSYEELLFSIENCGVVIEEVYAACYFKRTYPVFKNFIETLYSIKEMATEEKNEALRTFAKLIMNTGYGYTGMRRDDKTSFKNYKDIEKYDNIVFVSKEKGYIEVPTEINSSYIQVQVAATVTARARINLLKALLYADKNGEVYYCDTDSIVTTTVFPAEMIHKTKLGKWDLEAEVKKALFLRPKVYAEITKKGTNIKFKGLSKDTQKDLEFSDYEELYREMLEEKREYKNVEENRITLRSILYMQKEELDLNYYEERDKKINFMTKEKRRMNFAKNVTEPYNFNSIDDFENFTYNIKKEVVFNMV